MNISNHQFEGPFPLEDTSRIHNQSGVYVILTKNASATYDILDVGESAQLRTRIESHDREDCWQRNRQVGLYVAVLYCGEQDRMRIEKELREIYSPVCGVR